MAGELERYKIDVRWIERLETEAAAEWTTRSIRARLLVTNGVLVCDPENLVLHACRRPYPGDTDYVTTITAAGDFPRTLKQLAAVYDPRQWDDNPYAAYFADVHAVTDFSGSVPQTRLEKIGETWAEPAWISEHVTGPAASFLINTLNIQFVVTSKWLRLTYELGVTVSSSGLVMERDFGYLAVDELPGQPGWNRVKLEKNIRFSGTTGASGGDIGWGDLANLISPDLVGSWLHDMRYMPCWTPS